MKDDLYEKGLKLRREVLGDDYVDRSFANADRYTRSIQDYATKAAWGMVWSRPGISRKWRSVLNLGMLTALHMNDELKLHIAVALRNGLSREEICECLLQTSVYCGFPAALSAFRIAREVFAELDGDKPEKKKKKRRGKQA